MHSLAPGAFDQRTVPNISAIAIFQKGWGAQLDVDALGERENRAELF